MHALPFLPCRAAARRCCVLFVRAVVRAPNSRETIFVVANGSNDAFKHASLPTLSPLVRPALSFPFPAFCLLTRRLLLLSPRRLHRRCCWSLASVCLPRGRRAPRYNDGVLLVAVFLAVVVVLPVAPLLARFTVQGSRVPPPTQWTRSRRRMRRRRATGFFHTQTSADDSRRAASRPSDAHERAGSRCAPLNETNGTWPLGPAV